MATESEYKTIVGEMAQVLSRHKLSVHESYQASAMMFICAIEAEFAEYSDSEREVFGVRFVQNFYAVKRMEQIAKFRMN